MEVGGSLLVLVTYDVQTSSSGGTKRLRHVSRVCQNYGQRVQNSVFECIVDSAQFATIKKQLLHIIDLEKDSLRFYRMGNNYKNKVEHFGAKPSIDIEGPLVF